MVKEYKEHWRWSTYDPVLQEDGSWLDNTSDNFWINKAGELHREDGPAVISENGTEEWHLHGQRHREGGPAVIFTDGHMEWWFDGQKHNDTGPAVIYGNGKSDYWLKGKHLSYVDWCFAINPNMSQKEQVLLVLKHG